MQFATNLLLLMLSVGAGWCFLESGNYTVTRDERHIESPGYPHHTWRSERKLLTFTATDDNSHMVFYITGDFGKSNNCSRQTAGIIFKEAESGKNGKLVCGSGNFTYECHGVGAVTAVIAGGMEQKFRLTYTLKSNRCQETLFAHASDSIISSPDAARNMTRCQWNIVADYGYVVQIHVLMSNLSSPCYRNKVDVDLGDGSTWSWCGQQTSSYTSRSSRMSIRFKMSSVVGGHTFTLVYRRIPDPNRIHTQIWATSTPNVTSRPWLTKKQWVFTTRNPWLLHRLVTASHYWTPKNPPGTTRWQRNEQLWATATPNVTGRPWTTKKHWSLTTRNPWLLHRPVTASHYWTPKNPPGTTRWQRNEQLWATAIPNVTGRPWTTKKQWIFTTRNPWLLHRPVTTSHYWIPKKPSGTTQGQRNEQLWATTTPYASGRPMTTKKQWIFATRKSLHRPVTTSHYWTSQRPTETNHYRATQSPLRADNHTEFACVGGNVRTVTPTFQDQVLLLTTNTRTKSGFRVRAELPAKLDDRIELKLNFPWEVESSYHVCHDRYLEVFDGQSCNAPFLGKWCGQSNQTLVSTGQDLFLVYTDGRRYSSLPWTVHYRMTASDATPAVAPQTASSSSQAGVVVGSVFGVVLLVLAVVGALVTWRMHRRKSMSPYQNQDIINQSDACISVSMVTPASFSNAAYENVRSSENGKEGTVVPGNLYETPNSSEKQQFHPQMNTSLHQLLDPGLSKDKKSVTYDNQVRYDKGFSET